MIFKSIVPILPHCAYATVFARQAEGVRVTGDRSAAAPGTLLSRQAPLNVNMNIYSTLANQQTRVIRNFSFYIPFPLGPERVFINCTDTRR